MKGLRFAGSREGVCVKKRVRGSRMMGFRFLFSFCRVFSVRYRG